jgi:hypothetical protein
MQDDRYQFYASGTMQALFAREIAALASIVAGVYGNYGLFMRPHATARLALPEHLLGNMVELTPAGRGQFEGALRCTPWQLPFASESFKLLIAQHVLEQIDSPEQCAAELARVLAPEGVALILGFNPFGSWRPWLAWQAVRAKPHLCLRSAHAWRVHFAREQIDTLQIRFPGSLWPRANSGTQAASGLAERFARFGSSWLLLARKRRSTLTPLRLRTSAREFALNPRLAPGANRACA